MNITKEQARQIAYSMGFWDAYYGILKVPCAMKSGSRVSRAYRIGACSGRTRRWMETEEMNYPFSSPPKKEIWSWRRELQIKGTWIE